MGTDKTKKYPVIVKTIFGYRQYYIDNNTRVEYGFHLLDLGVSYRLQRKANLLWENRAWTYPSTHLNETIQDVIEYLLWYEDRYAIKKVKCHF